MLYLNKVSKLKRAITFHLKREARIMETIKTLEPSQSSEVFLHLLKVYSQLPTLKDYITRATPETQTKILQMFKQATDKEH